MQATQNEERSESPPTRERASRCAIESVMLSGHATGTRVADVVRGHNADGTHRIVITNTKRELPRDFVEHAFDALRYSALVCAPDGDGDIALIGLTKPHDALLATIPWGTDAALNELLRAAREQHVPVLLLPPPDNARRG